MNDLFKTMSITPRHCFTASKGKVFISLDFKNQEMYAAGVLSQDDLILNALLNEPETKKTIVDGKEIEYKNYLADLHTITCIKCCFPHLFENQPEYKFVDIAKDGSLIPQKGDPRLYSKVCNFGIIYGQTHVSMAKLNHVTEDLAKGWISQHKETFHKFHDWAEEQMHLAKIRGWSINAYSGRMRAVNEDNAKSAGASPARSGLNHQIQGLCADIGKESLVRVDKVAENIEGMDIRGFVHDELCITAYGNCELDEEKTEAQTTKNKGIWTPHYKYDEQARENALIVWEEMKAAQSKVLGGNYPGLVDFNIAPYWMH